MSEGTIKVGRTAGSWIAAFAVAFSLLTAASTAHAETRTLKLHFTHTNERAEIAYKRNGRFLPDGLKRVNHMLRDWRRNEAIDMDPRVVDLLWEVYQASGSRGYIHIVSAYRSPATNQMLRSRSSGVAENSQHTKGRAIDFFLPDVPVSKLRALGLRAHGGGVGYYPRSGSPFVHIDVGSVRHWPRMSRQELMAVFPDGRTIHVPSDGKPLPGYQQALAAYQSRQRSGSSVQLAAASSSPTAASSGGGGGLLATIFRGGSGNNAEAAAAPQRAPQPQVAVRQQAQPAPAAPQAPEPIIAGLPERDVPVPSFAPRPLVEVGPAQQAVAQVAAAPADAQPAGLPFEVRPSVDPGNLPFDLASIPVPTWRPELEQQIAAVKETPAPAQPTAPLATAAAGEPDLPAQLSVAALVGSRSVSAGSDAIEELLAAQAKRTQADVVVGNAMAPSSAVPPSADGDQSGVYVLASLPRPASASVMSDADDLALTETLKERAIAATRDSRVAPLPSDASPRNTVMSARQEGVSALAALDPGIRTTNKSSRIQPGTAARNERRSVPVPIAQDDARWVFEAGSVANMTAGIRAPSLAHDVVRTAPRAVYTAGFQQNPKQVDAGRFSGRAVEFLSVARFN